MAQPEDIKKIKVEWYRSIICTPKLHKSIVRALGFRKLNQILLRPDNAATRGAVAKVPHLLRIIE